MITAYEPKIYRFDLGVWAKLTTARKTFTCKVTGKPITRGEKYYTIRSQYGVTANPVRVKPEHLNLFFKLLQIKKALSFVAGDEAAIVSSPECTGASGDRPGTPLSCGCGCIGQFMQTVKESGN